MEDAAIILASIVAVLLALGLAIAVVIYIIVGAILLFRMAAEQGFVGLAAYLALWVFLAPLMLIISGVVGLLEVRWLKKEEE